MSEQPALIPAAITPTMVLGALGGHIGERNGITAKKLVVQILAGRDIPHLTSEGAQRQLRYAIVQLRNEGFHVCGHPATGYFLAANAEELDRTCAFLYQRAMSGLKQIAKMKKVSVPDLRGQLKLPT